MKGLGPVRLRSVLLSSYSYGGPGTCKTEVCTVVLIQFMKGLGPVSETEVCTVVLIQFMEGLGPVRLRSVLLSSYSS